MDSSSIDCLDLEKEMINLDLQKEIEKSVRQTIYFCTESPMTWYTFDIDNHDQNVVNVKTNSLIAERNGSQTPLLPKISPLLSNMEYGRFAGATSSGPYIFVVGGQEQDGRKAFLLHSRSGKRIDLPPMAVDRVRPVVAVFGRKLFAIGGNDGYHGVSDKWCEVFDINLWKWRTLPEPLYWPFADNMFSAVDYDKQMIFVGDLKSGLFCFDVRIECWIYFDNFDWDYELRGQAIVVDGAMHCWSHDKLWFYDPYTRDLFQAEVLGLREKAGYADTSNYSHKFHPSLLHLGGDRFCLLWMDARLQRDLTTSTTGAGRGDYAQVHCTIIRSVFTVDQATGKFSFKPFVESSRSYLIDPVLNWGHAFLL